MIRGNIVRGLGAALLAGQVYLTATAPTATNPTILSEMTGIERTVTKCPSRIVPFVCISSDEPLPGTWRENLQKAAYRSPVARDAYNAYWFGEATLNMTYTSPLLTVLFGAALLSIGSGRRKEELERRARWGPKYEFN